MNDPEVFKRYAVRSDGTTYAGHVLHKMRAKAQAQAQPAAADPLSPGFLEAQKAIAAAGGVYWLAELTVSSSPHATAVN